jgi:hypothetical protein
MADKEILRKALCEHYLDLDRSDDSARIFASFVAQSQGNNTIRRVTLFPYVVDPGNNELWDKVGQGVRNLKSLRVLCIPLNDSLGELDWEILARILPHIQSKIELQIIGRGIEGPEEMFCAGTMDTRSNAGSRKKHKMATRLASESELPCALRVSLVGWTSLPRDPHCSYTSRALG